MSFSWEEYKTHMIITGSGIILVMVLGYTLTPVGSFLVAPWTLQADVATSLEYIEQHPIEVANIVAGLNLESEEQDKKIEQLLKYHERDYLVGGTASVGTFGGDEAYIRINRRSDAKIYRDGDRVKVTILTQGNPDAVFVVRGSFADSRNPDLIISFSKEAAAELGITERCEVEIEPAPGGVNGVQ